MQKYLLYYELVKQYCNYTDGIIKDECINCI